MWRRAIRLADPISGVGVLACVLLDEEGPNWRRLGRPSGVSPSRLWGQPGSCRPPAGTSESRNRGTATGAGVTIRHRQVQRTLASGAKIVDYPKEEEPLMPGVFVVTDSSCDLEQDDIEPYNIEIVPLTIRFGSEEFTDRQDLGVEDFYQRMADSHDLPQTACPSPGAFEQAFRTARDADAEAVICLTISSDLSTTYQSAQTAASACEGQMLVHVLDSRTVSSGLGTLVIEAAKVAAEGADIETVMRRVERPHCSHARTRGPEHLGEPEEGWANRGRHGNGGVTAVDQARYRPHRWGRPRSREGSNSKEGAADALRRHMRRRCD